MLIIDQHVESKLTRTLEEARAQGNSTTLRCIHFKAAQQHPVSLSQEKLRQAVLSAAEHHLAAVNPEIFLCEDGDIFILAPSIPSKDARYVIFEVAAQLGVSASEDFAAFSEVYIQVNKLLMLVEQKAERKRIEVQSAKKQHDEQQAQRKREAILNPSAFAAKASDITRRRTARTRPELMIIEDDLFSRRLVENTLQKQYSLTALGNADNALTTYITLAPDILFLDINLPDVTGHELLEKFVALDPDAYIIMLSGNSDQANIVQAMSRGAKGFIAKPFTRDKLFQYIDRCPTLKH